MGRGLYRRVVCEEGGKYLKLETFKMCYGNLDFPFIFVTNRPCGLV